MEGQEGRVADQHGIDPAPAGKLQNPGGLAQLALADVDVERQIGPCPPGVRGLDGAGKLIGAKVACAAAGVEARQPEVDRARPRLQRGLQGRHVPGRREQRQAAHGG